MEMEREVKRLRSDLHEAIETRDFYNVSMSFNGIGTAGSCHIYLVVRLHFNRSCWKRVMRC